MSTSQTSASRRPRDAGEVATRPVVRWRLHPSVAVRPEPFGALLYHFGTRRLTFVKDRQLAEVLGGLDQYDSSDAAYLASGVPEARWSAFDAALQRLADQEMLIKASGAEVPR